MKIETKFNIGDEVVITLDDFKKREVVGTITSIMIYDNNLIYFNIKNTTDDGYYAVPEDHLKLAVQSQPSIGGLI